MKVYGVDCKDGDPSVYFATKREAVKYARDMARDHAPAGEIVEVEEVTLVPITKALILDLINLNGGYVDSARIVATFKSKKTEDA